MIKYIALLILAIPLAAYAWMSPVMLGGGVAGSGGYTTDIAIDTFATDPRTDRWTEQTAFEWQWSSGILTPPNSDAGVITNDIETGSVSHWIVAEFAVFNSSTTYSGLWFRYDGTIGNVAYALRYEHSNTDLVWRDCKGVSCHTIVTQDHTLTAGDIIGIEIEGTDASTVLRVWDFGTTAPDTPRASWGAATYTFSSEAWSAPDTGNGYANVGKNVGLYHGSNSSAVTISFSDFSAGTFTP